AARRAHLLLAAGGAIATAAALAGLLSALLLGDDASRDHRMALGTAVAVAMATGTLALLAGMLLLPGSADSPGAAARHLLDGLIIAAAIWFVSWVLVAGPTHVLRSW